MSDRYVQECHFITCSPVLSPRVIILAAINVLRMGSLNANRIIASVDICLGIQSGL